MDNIITNADGVKVKVRVYDFGDEVADRYTIVYVNKNIKDGYGVVYYPVFSCSEDPFHPLGVGMYAGDYYPHRSHMYNFGKRVKDIDSLPKKVIEFIKIYYTMNEITYNNYDLVAFEQNGEVVVAVTFYRYYKKKAKGEVNYRWRTRCPELVDKIVKHRTKVFTGQLIQLAKAYGEKKVIKYQKEEEEVCQDTIETR